MEELRRQSAEAEAGGGTERREREHKAGKLDSARTYRSAPRRRNFRGAGQICASPLRGLRNGGTTAGWRRFRHRIRAHRWPVSVRFRAGLHCLWRLALGSQRAENLQDHGSGDARRRSGHRPQRFRRRAHSGRCGCHSQVMRIFFCATRSPAG